MLDAKLKLKENHRDFPIAVFQKPSESRQKSFVVLMETFNQKFNQNFPEKYAEMVSFVVSITEAETRPQFIHEYVITDQTLKAATQVGYSVSQIKERLLLYSKYENIPAELEQTLDAIEKSQNFVSISLLNTKFYIVRLPSIFPQAKQNPKYDEIHKLLDESQERFEQSQSELLHDELFAQANQKRFKKRPIAVDKISNFRNLLHRIGDFSVVEEFYLGPYANQQQEIILKPEIVNSYKSIPRDFYQDYDTEKAKTYRNIELGVRKAFEVSIQYKTQAPLLGADLKSTTQLRPYQRYAVDRIVRELTIQRFNTQVQIKKLNSGMIVLPCGSGKSLQGIATACRIGRSCLVVTNTNLSSLQWKNQFLQFTTLEESRIFIFQATHETKTPPLFVPGYHTVFIGTYGMLTKQESSSTGYGNTIRQLVRSVCWGMTLFDEAHLLFARTFSTLFISGIEFKRKSKTQGEIQIQIPDNFIRSYCKVGLTATPLREDDNIDRDSHHLGCRLYESNWADLSRLGYLAELNCMQIQCSMTRYFYDKYMLCSQEHVEGLVDAAWAEDQLKEHQRIFNDEKFNYDKLAEKIKGTALECINEDQLKDLHQQQTELGKPSLIGPQTIAIINTKEKPEIPQCWRSLSDALRVINPGKLRIASLLKNYHEAQGHQVLFFCDQIVAAEFYARLLHIPFVDGDVADAEREAIIEAFLERKIQCFMLSRVGDTSLDLPDANVLIEIDWQGNARRQEVQRVGRISRPKNSGYEGYFYILMSEATSEVDKAKNRRTYLTQNQGYSYSVIEDTDVMKIMDEKKVKAERHLDFLDEKNLFHELTYLIWAKKQKKSAVRK